MASPCADGTFSLPRVPLSLLREERVPCYLPQEWLALNSHATPKKSMTFTRVPLPWARSLFFSNNLHRPLAIPSLSPFELLVLDYISGSQPLCVSPVDSR